MTTVFGHTARGRNNALWHAQTGLFVYGNFDIVLSHIMDHWTFGHYGHYWTIGGAELVWWG